MDKLYQEEKVYFMSMESPLGVIYIARSDKGILRISMGDPPGDRFFQKIKKMIPSPSFIEIKEKKQHRDKIQEKDTIMGDGGEAENKNSHEKKEGGEAILFQLKEEIDKYFKGEGNLDRQFPLDLRGTDFYISVWNELKKIPRGEVRTYGEIAQSLGKPKSYRAVGGACHNNPIPLLIPCHRVVGSDRSMTGFAGGIHKKVFLLNLEGVLKEGEEKIK